MKFNVNRTIKMTYGDVLNDQGGFFKAYIGDRYKSFNQRPRKL